MELLDIVDASDRVVGTAELDEIHRYGLRHRFIQVFVIDSMGRVLLRQSSSHGEDGTLLLDAAVCGHVCAGERYEEAARREASKQLGLPHDATYEPLGVIIDSSLPVENMIGQLFIVRADISVTVQNVDAKRLVLISAEELEFLTEHFPLRCTGGLLSSAELYLETLAGEVRHVL